MTTKKHLKHIASRRRARVKERESTRGKTIREREWAASVL